MFKGSFTALITPFADGNIDEATYASLIERQITNGTHGVVPSGTTGESPTLNHTEHARVTELCVQIVNGRIPVLAGTGSNSTAEAINLTQYAQKAGADGALIMTPYYNKPTQEGIYQHFKAIHDATSIPIILYNIPGRCVVDIETETILRLAKDLPRVVGIKDATGDLSRPKALLDAGISPDFYQLSGDDETAVEFNKLGGHGAISVTSNLMPKECSRLQQACLDGQYAEAQTIQDTLMELHSILFCESSPQPAKYAAGLMKICTSEMRLPMVQPSEENQERIKATLQKMKII